MSTAVLELPGLVDPAIPTRDAVQAAMVDALVDDRLNGRASGINQAATGVGKTRVATKFVKRGIDEWDGRFLFVVHRKELLKQAAAAFTRAGVPFDIEWADLRADRGGSLLGRPPLVIASKDSLQNNRLASFARDTFTDIILDECHLSTATSWGAILSHFERRFLVGLTATAFRMDGVPLYGTPDSPFQGTGYRGPRPFEVLKDGEPGIHRAFSYRYPLPVAVANGHLVNIRVVTCQTDVNLKSVRTTKGKKDWNRGDLEDRIGKAVNPLADAIKQEIQRLGLKRILVFTPDVGSAQAMASVLSEKGVASRAVHGNTKAHPLPDRIRDLRIQQHQEGDYPGLVSCDLLTTGYDDDRIDAVVICRPTKSLGLFMQMVGRGTRLCPEIAKRHVTVIGFAWQDGGDAVSSVDLFLEDEPDPRVREIARKLAATARDADARDVAEKAREIKARDDEEERRRAERASLRVKDDRKTVQYKRVEWTPFGAATATLLGIGTLTRPDPSHRENLEPIAPARKSFLETYGLKQVDGLPDATAATLADAAIDRVFRGLCSAAEVNELVKRGVPRSQAETMPKRDAEPILRRPLPVSEKMHRWLRNQGFPEDRILRMTADEAKRHFLRITQPRRA